MKEKEFSHYKAKRKEKIVAWVFRASHSVFSIGAKRQKDNVCPKTELSWSAKDKSGRGEKVDDRGQSLEKMKVR